MRFCLECGGKLETLGGAKWSSGVILYGCSQCDILWEAHICSVSGRGTGYEKSDWSLAKWKKYYGK